MPVSPPKAYKNMAFLNSAEARTLRILAEYMEPRARFEHQEVKDTIVFFGSARVQSEEQAQEEVAAAQKAYSEKSSSENKNRKKIAEKKLTLSCYYEDARTLAKMLTQWSLGLDGKKQRFVVTSGGGPGIMEAANRGASEVPEGRSVGLNISIPNEQGGNPYITNTLNFEFHYFFTRKFWFVYLAKGVVVFPGGFGTLDELWEVLTLIQTQKVQKKMPVILYGESYWKQLINFDFLIENCMIHEDDLELIHFSNDPENAFEYLQKQLGTHFL